MTGFQLTRPQAAVAPTPAPWVEPAVSAQRVTGRHASSVRAKLNLRRMFYTAKHATR